MPGKRGQSPGRTQQQNQHFSPAQCNNTVDIVVLHVYRVVVANKIMHSLRLDPEHSKLLRAIQERDGIPASEQMRRGLLLWFAQKGVVKTKGKK